MSLVAKLATCIIAAGATSCGLLVIRQHRIETAYEMSRIHHDLVNREQQTWSLRVKVHERVGQDRVATFARSLEEQLGARLVPIYLDPTLIGPIESDPGDAWLASGPAEGLHSAAQAAALLNP